MNMGGNNYQQRPSGINQTGSSGSGLMMSNSDQNQMMNSRQQTMGGADNSNTGIPDFKKIVENL